MHKTSRHHAQIGAIEKVSALPAQLIPNARSSNRQIGVHMEGVARRVREIIPPFVGKGRSVLGYLECVAAIHV